MESIQQFELILMSTMGSSSPSKCPVTEEVLFGDNYDNDLFLKSDDEFTGIDFLAELDKDGKMYTEELQQITNNIDLPLYDFVTGNDFEHQTDFNNQKPSKTEELLMEFDSIYDAVELDHLTPPQTPSEQKLLMSKAEKIPMQPIPSIVQDQQFIFDYQHEHSCPSDQYIYLQNEVSLPDQNIAILYDKSNSSVTSCDSFGSNEIIIDPEPIISSPADFQREQEVVDEIIQAHSRSQSDYDDDNCTQFTSSSWSSERSECSGSNYFQDEQSCKKSKSKLQGVGKKRTRPYGRNPDEKKSRKKEQNKNAATRYRQKKKEEVHVILSEEQILTEKNQKLTMLFNDTRREVKYLKSLLRELFQARGFIQ